VSKGDLNKQNLIDRALDQSKSPQQKAIEEKVIDALRLVYDPEIPVDLVNLGLIYEVKVDQEQRRVDIKMTLTAPGCGMGPVLVGDVEYRVRKVPNVETVKVELVFDPPWRREMMSEEAQLETGMIF
jgi:probable FeS assembly SUF system protein SufT